MVNIYFMDFGVIVQDKNKWILIKYYETKRLFSLIEKADNVLMLDASKISIDRKSNKKLKYWKNKVKKEIRLISSVGYIEQLLNALPEKYNDFLYTKD